MAKADNSDSWVSTGTIVSVYPIGVFVASVLLNRFLLGVSPIDIALPSHQLLVFVIVASVLLVANHTWLMTSTELSRLRFGMYAAPEEWNAAEASRADVPEKGWLELERRHNAHRNATENTVYFGLLVGVFSLVSPSPAAAGVWIIGFGVARLGHTFGYLSGNTSLRGLFMTLSLLAMYGMASYLLMGLF